MNLHADIAVSLKKLISYIEHENYRGYDPYDTLRTPFPLKIFGTFISAIATQVQKRNPVNIRPLIGINKDYNPKALGIILHAYTLLHDEENNYSEQMDFIAEKIYSLKSKKFHGSSWGYNFDWASPGKYLAAYEPNVVVTSFIAKGLFAYYSLTGNKKAKDELIRIGEFIEKDIPVTETQEGICFSYTPYKTDCCYNASMLAAEILARIFTITGDQEQKNKAVNATEFVLAHQHSDGHWEYKIDMETGKERHQIDFHQGYIIDSISDVMHYTGNNKASFNNAVVSGAQFYHDQQFFPEGRSLWRLPKEYPVEIHNQSQGIITFARLSDRFDWAKEFSGTIAKWTIENMQDEKGFFYYRRLKHYTNRISFMRWSNAWMMLALAELLNASKKFKYAA